MGLNHAAQLAKKYSKIAIPINHLEGHVLSVLAQPRLKTKLNTKTNQVISPSLPALSVIVSGGHTEFVLVKQIGRYQRLGATVDDAAGECLDKVGRLLNLGYPAGPVVEQLAKKGDTTRFKFPLPMTEIKTFNMSFSGLKTHSRRLINELETKNQLDRQTIADFCASLQEGVFNHITYKLAKLLNQVSVKELWLGGGVAANMTLRRKLRQVAKEHQLPLRVPYTKKLCGDNAAMIGVVSSFKSLKPSANLDRKPGWRIDD